MFNATSKAIGEQISPARISETVNFQQDVNSLLAKSVSSYSEMAGDERFAFWTYFVITLICIITFLLLFYLTVTVV